MIITPRVDHIRRVKVLDEDIRPQPKDFDISYYYSTVYKMYGGPEMDVTIECPNSLIGHFIDRFGTDFEAEPVGDSAFRATVHTCVGSTFFGWPVARMERLITLPSSTTRMNLIPPAVDPALSPSHMATKTSIWEATDQLLKFVVTKPVVEKTEAISKAL